MYLESQRKVYRKDSENLKNNEILEYEDKNNLMSHHNNTNFPTVPKFPIFSEYNF